VVSSVFGIRSLILCVYVIQDVTPQNFLAVLKGDSAGVKGGSGKVLKRLVSIQIFIRV